MSSIIIVIYSKISQMKIKNVYVSDEYKETPKVIIKSYLIWRLGILLKNLYKKGEDVDLNFEWPK